MAERDLIIPVNGIYFDQILAGTKPEEFRKVTDYWTKRLNNGPYRHVVMTRGYPKGGGVEGVTRTSRVWRGFRQTTITHPHFDDVPTEVYAIDVSQRPEHRESGE